jgi:hypothetical protein
VVDEEVADVVAELVVPLVLLAWLHADPSRANPAIAMENAAVRLVISRISFPLELDRTDVGLSNSDAIALGDRPASIKFANSYRANCDDLSYCSSASGWPPPALQ